MKHVLQLIEHELITKLLGGQLSLAPTNKTEQFFGAFCGGCLVVGTVLTIYAAYLWLVGLYSAPAAIALVGAMGIGCAFLLAGLLYGITAYKRKRIIQIQQSLYEQLKVSLSEFEEAFGEPVRDYPKTSVFIASLVGLLLERRIL